MMKKTASTLTSALIVVGFLMLVVCAAGCDEGNGPTPQWRDPDKTTVVVPECGPDLIPVPCGIRMVAEAGFTYTYYDGKRERPARLIRIRPDGDWELRITVDAVK